MFSTPLPYSTLVEVNGEWCIVSTESVFIFLDRFEGPSLRIKFHWVQIVVFEDF
jgi:hypothetical protein